MNNEKGNNNFWVGFFLGGLVGAFIIFFMGTKQGKKLADQLIEDTEGYEEELEEKVAILQKKGEEFLKGAREVKNKVIKEVESGRKEVNERLVTRMDEALTIIEDIQKKGVELTEDVHHHYFKRNGKKLTS